MGKIRKFVALATVMALFSGQVQGQGTEPYYEAPAEESPAYADSERSSYLSIAIPIGALVIAAIIIATTHHHHHSSSSSSTSTNVH